MLFRNSIKLLMENFKNVYKILLYKFIVGLVAGALCAALILPELVELLASPQWQKVVTDVKSFFSAFFAANATALEEVKNAMFGENGSLYALAQMVLSKMTAIVLTTVGCVLIYLLKRFAETLCYFSVGSILNDKMSTYAETSFGTAYVSNVGKASRYALVYVPVVFLFDLLTVSMIVLLMTTVNIIPALFFSVTLLVLMQSVKLTFTGVWLPAMTTDGKKLRNAFAYKKTEKKQLPKIFATYIVTVYLVIIVNIVAAVCTFGSALIVTVPASYMVFICEQFVNYYTIKGKKYFITFDRIASNPDCGDREHIFEYIDETALDPTVAISTERNAEEKTQETQE